MSDRWLILAVYLVLSSVASAIPAPNIAPVTAVVPSSSPSAAPSVLNGSLGGIAQSIPIRPYLNGTDLPDNTLLQNLTVRFVGENLYNATAAFRTVVEDTCWQLLAGPSNLFLDFTYRPGVMVPVIGPSGLNGSRTAYAPTPGRVPENFGRKLLQSTKPFNKEVYQNRFQVFMAIDVEILARGGANASIVQILHPTQLMGYLTVVMAQRSLQVQATPINISTTSNILPITNRMPLTPTYVLGTVMQVTGTDLAPLNTQAQTMMLLTLNSLFGSQNSFLNDRISSVWEDSTPSQDTVRLAIHTYTDSYVSSMNEIAGGDVPTLMIQIAQATGANFTVYVYNSQNIGTQADELAGKTFALDLENPVRQQVDSSSGLSGGQIAGIVIGSVAGLLVALAIASMIGFLVIRRTRRNGRKADTVPASHPLQKAILGSGGAGDNSSGIIGSKGSSNGSSERQTPTAEHLHPLSDAWNIDPTELAVCQLPDGRDWLLGAGSFGQVFRGLRGGVQDVAIKQIIKPGDMHLRMFEKEVALLRHLNFDKNLVQFYGACVADDNLMLVLEYMDGGDLKEALGNDPVGEFGWYGKGGSVLMDVARGLHFLHSNKVAHRDLKTKNILMSKSGEAKIGDVGLAKLVGSQLLSTQLDTAGTFAYAAPELLLGEPCDQSADIYSFGVIMWEVLTHEIPVRGALRGIDVTREGPQEAADLIEHCLQRGPKARPTAKEIFERLQSLLMLPGASLPPVLESSERPYLDEGELRSDHTSVEGELSPKHSLPAFQSTSLGSKRTNSSGDHADVTTGETGVSSISTGPHASPDASKKRLASA